MTCTWCRTITPPRMSHSLLTLLITASLHWYSPRLTEVGDNRLDLQHLCKEAPPLVLVDLCSVFMLKVTESCSEGAKAGTTLFHTCTTLA